MRASIYSILKGRRIEQCFCSRTRHLKQVFRKFAEVNQKKSITFFSGQGISPDPKKVYIEAIKNAKPPTMTSGVRSFLGMATYTVWSSSRISATPLEPLREFTKMPNFNGVSDIWAVVQQDQRATRQCQGNGTLQPKQRNRTGHWCFSLRIICHPDAEHTRKRRQMSSYILQPSSYWCRKTLFPDRKRSTSNRLGSREAPSLSLQRSFQIWSLTASCSVWPVHNNSRHIVNRLIHYTEHWVLE